MMDEQEYVRVSHVSNGQPAEAHCKFSNGKTVRHVTAIVVIGKDRLPFQYFGVVQYRPSAGNSRQDASGPVTGNYKRL